MVSVFYLYSMFSAAKIEKKRESTKESRFFYHNDE